MSQGIAAIAVLAMLTAASGVRAEPRPGGAASAVRDGYALLADPSPQAASLPRIYGSARGFYDELDLPDMSQYVEETLRYTSTGLAPTRVIQLAVVRPGEPVQVMVVRATGPSHLKEATRIFGALPWADFVALRDRALAAMLHAPPQQQQAPQTGADIAVTAVDQICTLEFGGSDLVVRRRVDCLGGDAFETLTEALIDIGDRAAPAARSTGGGR